MSRKFKKLTMILILAGISACTGQRQAKFADGQGDDIYEKSLFTNAVVQLSLLEQQQEIDKASALRSSGEKAKVKGVATDTYTCIWSIAVIHIYSCFWIRMSKRT